ncbi:hypothetical protein [Streptomyces marokkonensis]|uniref:hypothetical protein n=1 Tax=Streptomyces marokkonensis TaxID=324855 RepID=UPI0031E9571D
MAGPTLDRAVRETGLPPVETVLHLGLGLARALRGIHHARVRHRDLKPANVLLGADGPGSLEVVGDSLHLHGRGETLALDTEGGRPLAEAAERCEPVARGAAHLSCPSGVRDGTTLEKAEGDYRGERLLALSRTGVLLSSREGASDAEQAELVARDVTTGRVRWTEPWPGRGTLRIAGDQLLVADQEGVGTALLADGQGVGTYRDTFSGWSSAGEGPTSTLVHGGAVFVTFEDGTVLSAFAP